METVAPYGEIIDVIKENAKEGMTVLEAALSVGIAIPLYPLRPMCKILR